MTEQKNQLGRRSFIKTGSLAMGSLYGIDSLLGTIPGDELNAAEITAVQSGEIVSPKFVKAKPVWEAGREKEMNVTLAFLVSFKIGEGCNPAGTILRMTGSTIARIKVNGELAGYGPARGPHGWFRVDEWNIGPYLRTGANEVMIEIAGYNSNSYYLLDQPSFLQAEIVDEQGKVLAATDADDSQSKTKFIAFDNTPVRIQKVQRFSFQRPFIEVYDLTRHPKESVKLATQPEVKYLPRRVPYTQFNRLEPVAWLKSGTAVAHQMKEPWRDRSLTGIGPKLKGYKIEELELLLSDKVQSYTTKLDPKAAPKGPGTTYHNGDVQIVDFGANNAGFFCLEVDSLEEGTELAITFDEILGGDSDVHFLRLGTCSAIQWTLGKTSNNQLLAFEPHVARYAKIHCLKGSFTLKNFYMREYAYPTTKDATFRAEDARLEKLFRAAVLTFRTNSVDVFMDCPHRERAGWLCDSFFTARTAFDLTGKTDVEQAFMENYRLPEKFAFLPDGMLPMCYPADHYDGIYIPNWALWFVVELEEYAHRSPDRSTIIGLKSKIEKLMAFFLKYENSDGLLEKLPSWVFVEWSAANGFVQDVNYPSNMLYAAALDAAGKIYHNDAWKRKAAKIRQTIIDQSYDGTFFIDNAIRKPDGSLARTKNRSEVCQYFAFFYKTATPQSHPELWNRLLNEFGPERVKKGGWSEIHQANSFVGNVLRLELLSWADRSEQLLQECVAYNEYMADRTGTLWENDKPSASCSHGFASHLAHVLYRDVLGIAQVDPIEKVILIRFKKFVKLNWSEGTMPVPGGLIKVRWEKKDGKLLYSLNAPEQYRVTVENTSGLELVKG